VELVLLSVGILIVVSVLLRVGLLLVSASRQFAHKQRQRQIELEILTERLETLKKIRADEESARTSWGGFRKFVVREKIPEGGGDICSFYLTPHDQKPLPSFQPGQYLTFKFNIPGTPKPVTRCYSLSDSPTHPDYYRITVKKIPSGVASTYLHEQTQKGDIIDVKAPGGKFVLDITSQKPIVLIGGGVGITPLLCMLNTLTLKGSKQEVWLFYGVRNGAQRVMKDHLAGLIEKFDNVHLRVCYSQPSEEDILGKTYDYTGHVSVDLLKQWLPSNNYGFYICGPPEMMGTITHGLKDWGVPDDQIAYEAFGPATVKKVPSSASPDSVAQGIEVFFAKSGKKCVWEAQGGTLLELAEGNGVAIDFGCRAGNCGTCLTAVKSGGVRYLSEPGFAPEAGSCLTCISVPKTSLTLDA